MNIICLCAGKKHDKTIAQAIEVYQTRLQPYAQLRFELVPTGSKEVESQRILQRLKSTDYVVLLDETGELVNNQALARLFDDAQTNGVKNMVMIIGGAYGVTDEVKARSNTMISLSNLVFPHQLVRLILMEQLYRSFNLLAGGKYHHE